MTVLEFVGKSEAPDEFLLERLEGGGVLCQNGLDAGLSESLEVDEYREPHNFDAFMDLLCRVLTDLKDSGKTTTKLANIKDCLSKVHESAFIWTVAIPMASPHLWNRLLHLYFSIPDRITAVFEPSPASDSLSRERFYRHICLSIPEDGGMDRIVDFAKRFYFSGQLPLLLEFLLSQGHVNAARLCLGKLTDPVATVFARELLHLLDVLYGDKPLQLLQRMVDFQYVLLHLPTTSLEAILSDCPPSIFSCLCYDPQASSAMTKALSSLTQLWSLHSTVQRMPPSQQRHLTKLILIGLSVHNYETLTSNKLECWLLDGIQRRLDGTDEAISTLGKVVAECFAILTPVETRLIFAVQGPLAEDLRKWFSHLTRLEEEILSSRGGCVVHSQLSFTEPVPKDEEPEAVDDHMLGEPIVPSVNCSTLKSKFKTLINITEKDETSRNAKIKAPTYLRDCLAYLKCADDPEKVRLAMYSIVDLFRKSSRILQEELGVELYKTVLYSVESFNIVEFNELRIAFLGVLVTDVPRVIGRAFVEEMTSRNSSIRQRLEATCSCVAAIRRQHHLPKQTAPNNLPTSTIRFNLLDKHLGLFAKGSVDVLVNRSPALIVRHLVVPLLKIVRDADSGIFQGNANTLLLEKLEFLLAVSIDALTGHADYVELCRLTLTFLKPLLDINRSLPRPIQKALVVALNTVTSGWPETFSILELLSEFTVVAKYLEGLFDSSSDRAMAELGDDILLLAADSLSKLQKLGDPAELIRAAAEASSGEISLLSTSCRPEIKF